MTRRKKAARIEKSRPEPRRLFELEDRLHGDHEQRQSALRGPDAPRTPLNIGRLVIGWRHEPLWELVNRYPLITQGHPHVAYVAAHYLARAGIHTVEEIDSVIDTLRGQPEFEKAGANVRYRVDSLRRAGAQNVNVKAILTFSPLESSDTLLNERTAARRYMQRYTNLSASPAIAEGSVDLVIARTNNGRPESAMQLERFIERSIPLLPEVITLGPLTRC